MNFPKVNDTLVLNRQVVEKIIGEELTYKVLQINDNYITIIPTFKYNNKCSKLLKINEIQTGEWAMLQLNGWELKIVS